MLCLIRNRSSFTALVKGLGRGLVLRKTALVPSLYDVGLFLYTFALELI